jgi:hypothetical protein
LKIPAEGAIHQASVVELPFLTKAAPAAQERSP